MRSTSIPTRVLRKKGGGPRTVFVEYCIYYNRSSHTSPEQNTNDYSNNMGWLLIPKLPPVPPSDKPCPLEQWPISVQPKQVWQSEPRTKGGNTSDNEGCGSKLWGMRVRVKSTGWRRQSPRLGQPSTRKTWKRCRYRRRYQMPSHREADRRQSPTQGSR